MVWKRLYTLLTCFALGAALFGAAPAAAQQTGTITGTVTDSETGEALPGANVVVPNSPIGTSTGVDGTYSLSIEPGTYTLRASFVGYSASTEEDVTVTEGETVELDFALATGTSLDEIVVVGYGEQERGELTTSISSISEDDLANRSLTDPTEALQGTIPGLVVTQNSGSPGQGFSVRIRGIASPGNNDPLYVVDGLPLPDRPDYLNPNDIASIDVIKDAAGAAIYGTQGANGVILITTKKGQAGETRVSFNAQYGASEVPGQLDMAEAAEYATLRNEAAINADQAPVYENPTALRGQSTNWQDEIFQTGTFQKYSLGVSGGGDGFSFRVSGDFTDETGIVKTSDFRQINFRINTEYTSESGLFTVGENLSIGRDFRNTVPEGNDVSNFLIQTLQFSPAQPVRDPSLNTTDNYTFSRFGNNANNPVAVLDFNNSEDRATRLAGNVFADLMPIDGLTLRSDFGLDLRYGDNYSFTPTYEVSPTFRNTINGVNRYSDQRTSLIWTNTAEYSRVFGEQHDVTVLGGTSAEWNTYEFVSAGAQVLPSEDPSLRYLDQADGSQSAGGNLEQSRLLSYFSRLNYSYGGRYLATIVARYDGSTRFGENKRFGFFPSFSAAWRLSEEDFMDDVEWVNDLKVRGGYGINGNDAIDDFAFLTTIETFPAYILGEGNFTPGATLGGAGNPDLQWEESRQTSFGLDATLLDRLSVNAEYYVKNTSDLLLVVPQLSTSGAQRDGQVQNAGDIQNSGFELALSWSDTALDGDLTYDVGANIATVSNEVKSLGASTGIDRGSYRQGNITRTVVGQPIGSFYGYVTDGLFQTQEEVDEHAFQSGGTAPGDIRFRDLNDDGVINDDDRTFIGNPFPDFTYGINGRVAFRGFDLSVLLQGVSGNELFAAYEYYTLGSGIFNLEEDALDRWTGPGTSTDMPRLTVSDPNLNTRISDRYVRDGSYLRLKNVTFGYTVPDRLFDAVGASVRSARVFVSGQNLLTLTGYEGFDPEIGERNGVLDRGIDRGVYPQSRTVTVGLDFQF
ncbi:SusC/RagA family TonB-linked outer membrane protein [Longimonas halophila]|uniref:SusC/RagA family TonB-linked outer membrane protein n=1 Tax=Longimonas halophila TaxID=1469170 RepID=A0A2H3NI64_9BACT|nr:TonB-dependent receptor [Longimonas halophila]PEN05026.1 SusC/RagA family TonB-linked outer membrane protein [Longimonas halophila]